MRKYEEKSDKTKKNYYEDRFFVVEETKKDPVEGTRFEDDYKALSKFDIKNAYVEFDQLVIYAPKEQNYDILNTFKSIGYDILSDISAVDFLSTKGVIEVFYQLLNMTEIKRARLKVEIKKNEFLQSVTPLFKSANWAERELYDMFGVWIKDHPNLSRIIMPDDWYGHPLLKSYPLKGDEVANWYEVDKIFGKEYRHIIGEENRDSSFVDSKDTFNFSRVYYDTEFGGKTPENSHLQEYQEEGGIRLIRKLKRKNSKILKKRK